MNSARFTCELPHAIEQEIHARILVANITAALCTQAHERLTDDKAEHYRVNQTTAIKHWPSLAVAWIKGVTNAGAATGGTGGVVDAQRRQAAAWLLMSAQFRRARCPTASAGLSLTHLNLMALVWGLGAKHPWLPD